MKKIITATAAAGLLAASVHATIAPRYDVTIDASKSVTSQKQRLEMAQAGNQDFGFTFSNLQGSLATNDAVRWYYTAADLSWQVAVTGSVEDADTALVQVSPAYSNTNTLNDGAFPWRLEVQDAEDGTILATACGSLIIPQNPLAPGQPALVTTTNINTADYTVTGQWPASSIPDLSGSYETAATNDPGSAGQVLTTDGSGNNYWSGAGAGDMVGANNLSDVASAATSRTNLGLGSAATNDASAFATAAQGALADTALQPATLNAHTNLALASGAHGGELDPVWSATDLAANNGGSLTNLNADNLASGTVPDARIGNDIARDSELATYLPLAGGTMTGQLVVDKDVNGNTVRAINDTANGIALRGESNGASGRGVSGLATASNAVGVGAYATDPDSTALDATGIGGAKAATFSGAVEITSGLFSLPLGTTVNDIETSMTDNAYALATSAAIIDYGNANWSGGGDPPATNTTTVAMTNQVNFPNGLQIGGVPLTSIDTNGTIAANLALSADVTGLAAGPTLVSWTDVEDDTHSGYDSGSSTYYAPEPGWYIHTVSFRLSGLDDGRIGQCIWYQAGDESISAVTVGTSSKANNTTFMTPPLTRIAYAASTNTYWYVQVAHNNGDTDPFLDAGSAGNRTTRWTIGYLGQ